jgi:uncharacterized protein (DUF1015 family)
MAKVYPFRALRYAPSKVSIDKVVTQPYDKISPAMQDRYYALHANNIIRIILGKADPADTSTNNVYTRAATTMKQWREAGILEKVPEPVFIVYFQKFTIPGTSEVRVRKGFVGTAQLEDYDNKVVYPHERTLSGPKKDRLELLRHTRTQFEQIFMLYEDPEQRIDRVLEEVAMRKPDIEVLDEYGVTHTMWTVTDRKVIEFIQRQMASKKMIIADGHHRYETALTYRDERRAAAGKTDPNASYERMPMTFFNMHAPGLTILPTHRVVSNLPAFDSDTFLQRAAEFFDVSPAAGDAERIRMGLRRMGESRVTIGVVTDRGERIHFLQLKPSLDLAAIMPDVSEKQRVLDVVVLHRLLIERCLGISEDAVKKESNIAYMREMDGAINAVRTGTAQLSFLLNPTGLNQMRDVAYEGNVMPQKSTDFYPKVLSGLMMYPLED